MTMLETKSLAVSVGNKTVCKHMDYKLGQGECWGVLGINGIGKTTLLHVLAGLRQPDRGEILIEHSNINSYPRKSLATKIGLLFQDSEDTFPGTVMETVLAGRYPHLPFWSLESANDIDLARNALAELDLLSMSERQVNTLSGGERRRLAIATLFVQDPAIWLLDEPTNHLDLHQQIVILETIVNKVADRNGAAMMVLHDVNLLARFCTHALLMIDANTLLGGPVEDVLNVENLQRLYHHPVRIMEDDRMKLFYPL